MWNTVHLATRSTDSESPGRSSSGRIVFESVGREPAPRVADPGRAWTAAASQIWLDVVYAVRGGCALNPGFTAFSVLTLALGIGATTALYSVIYSTILKPLNVRDLDTLVNIYHSIRCAAARSRDDVAARLRGSSANADGVLGRRRARAVPGSGRRQRRR